MLALALLLVSVRPELVEGRAQNSRASTGSARTGKELGTVIEIERAFAAAAQRDGQWTAFRAYAAPDATMFVPQPVKAQEWLKGRMDPKTAIVWSPTAAWVSCDGKWAVTTGEWRLPDGQGYFSTVWRKGSDRRWRWLVDGGDELTTARPRTAQPTLRIAHCGGAGRGSGYGSEPNSGYGASGDATLRWRWHVAADGARTFTAELWNGRTYETVVDDRIAAPAKP